jgi:hypothetical protein
VVTVGSVGPRTRAGQSAEGAGGVGGAKEEK